MTNPTDLAARFEAKREECADRDALAKLAEISRNAGGLAGLSEFLEELASEADLYAMGAPRAERLRIYSSVVAGLTSAAPRHAVQPYTLAADEGGTFLQAEAGQLFICADINTVRRCLAAIGVSAACNDPALATLATGGARG